ncbi:carbohydrate sulfotransferase 3-like [Patiria miniata]|uniref:Sulfotransferase domain-containing protein n=1 Tax=Patiria miniata TaxID=46514 RepID=A0A913ZF87_PATMI|nr:carbohydrate sulfotransferase 3-like [Patiria miniata]XP_038050118.1 carbohydrate sulfotransferase 3-like [Patiria miniata]XP_038050119.1 carbohydrate sulfotransferase 3-like [Patiria miniata]
MHTISRGIIFIVIGSIFVLLSLLMYTEVLSRRSKWFEHAYPTGMISYRNRLKSRPYLEFSQGESMTNSVLDVSRRKKQRQYHTMNITRLSFNGSEKVGPAHPVGLKIMIMGRMRTGSTLLGEVLNQNPNLFYLFEPLHATDALVNLRLMDSSKMEASMATLLRKLSQCTFPSEFMYDIYNWRIARGKSRTIQEMCEGKFRCTKANPTLFNARCVRRRGNMAMKMIRADLETIKPLVLEDHLNVKILHLVRDPRGTANSRKRFYCPRRHVPPEQCSLYTMGLLENEPQLIKYKTIHRYCQWMRETVQVALARPDWLQGRYKLIRYEDMALEPLRFAKDIYNFLKLPLHPQVTDWVKSNTQENTQKSSKVFNTKKNSTEAAQSWRNTLSFKEAKDVEKKCGDVMELLGYRLVESEEDLTNYEVPVTSPLNIGSDISFT